MIPSVEQYFKEKAAYDAAKPAPMEVKPMESPLFNHSILFKTIEDRNEMSDSELRYFIQRSFQAIMNNVFDSAVGARYVVAFQDERFLDAFIDVLLQMQFYDSDVIVRLNLICYHYLTLPEMSKRAEVSQRMLKLSGIINRNKLIQMKKFGLQPNLESLLIVARFSDFDLSICVKRVNLMMVTSPQIYKKLNLGDPYDAPTDDTIRLLSQLLLELYRVEDWNFVLGHFMLDVLPEYDEYNNQWVTPEVEAVDSAMCLAVLKILDEMIDSSAKLREIMITYAEGYRIMNKRAPVKFSFQTISYEYQRLSSVIKYLAEEENIYVP